MSSNQIDHEPSWGRTAGVLLFALAFIAAALFMVWIIVILLRAIF